MRFLDSQSKESKKYTVAIVVVVFISEYNHYFYYVITTNILTWRFTILTHLYKYGWMSVEIPISLQIYKYWHSSIQGKQHTAISTIDLSPISLAQILNHSSSFGMYKY